MSLFKKATSRSWHREPKGFLHSKGTLLGSRDVAQQEARGLISVPGWAASRKPGGDPDVSSRPGARAPTPCPVPITAQTSLYSPGPSSLTPSQLPSGPCLCPTSGETVNKPSFLSGAYCLENIYSLLLAWLRHLFSPV